MEVLLLPEHPNRDKNARTKIDFLIIDYWISYKQCKDSQLLSGIIQSESTFFRETQFATVLQRFFLASGLMEGYFCHKNKSI
jgi:hypothetical protein